MDERGEPVVDETALILLNAHHESITFTLPETRDGQIWERVLDTSAEDDTPLSLRGGEELALGDRSLVVLFTRDESEAKLPASRTEIESLRREAQAAASRAVAQGCMPTDSASLRFFRQRIASGSANSSRQRIASLCASHDVFPPWSTG